jgi:hypothetical protein
MSEINTQMPCGFVVTRSLQDLGHYKKCADPACKDRAIAWENLKAEAATPIKAILQRKK